MTSAPAPKFLYKFTFLLLCLVAPTAAHACSPGAVFARCPGTGSVWDNRARPLTREDINARIGTPGAPIGGAVTTDTDRTWEAVRRQPRRPVIANPADPSDREPRGERP